ncbi:TetR/AcrR family transcriptional regulator [Bradyrhizobium sp. U87765 SZCCT0131]|uniref:TetR/AcrR family transcriptional regulator n=1 Tax=unclassified Bradyrhizobium TaxID=2631580 RepID=UPI001BADE962|nr:MULTISPECIES: TetR-like C-terminal domain-containing protein [unclassified Bradyrhizobium]MBR1218381.1 TetR/AcrR family transcriptional regulator [Bradyrhizobium sp. U87765 SZCCT0131]MBR1260673.1 TetR/AcrR family transcriptional regulator [Bradyrhizobium sp. U87765 SZCCT0134]MBR1303879.1 TetR/AcrR family transcriptional regulator [Bradyrhizobium sp. U87765 SZCCT0110]MBR1319485.1 TetR/AcrR family transcriptional regulator [Bradyrhizobium sp. U87765 SZCCT0109]MBR1347810.1 TetR/AcrR family tra
MSKTMERRDRLREALIGAAETVIATKGLGGLKSRDLAREIGCSNGAVFNLVESMDELVLRVGSRTLARLDAALTEAEGRRAPAPGETLVDIAEAYCAFAAENLELWRALFEHRMEPGRTIPEWVIAEQMHLFRHIHQPLVALFPDRAPAALGVTARSLFSAVHGMVLLGLEQKLIAVPIDALREEIATMVRAMIRGLLADASPAPPAR